jgi:IMP dehydrogenase/GMP reductase
LPGFYERLASAPLAFTFRDLILLPGLSEVEPSEVTLRTYFTKDIQLSLPFVSSPMDTVTEESLAIALARSGGIGVIHRNMPRERQVEMVKAVKSADPQLDKNPRATVDARGCLMVAAATSPLDIERARALAGAADALVSDVSHFHNRNVLMAARRIVREVSVPFVAGNIGTSRAVEDTIAVVERVDGFRVGIGSGSTCITSEVTKAGAPTLYAVAQAADALRRLNLRIPIIADGGIRTPGDAALALAAGASSVMMGLVFAGCTESAGRIVEVGGRQYKAHRGMGSASARQVRFAADRYAASPKGISEGVEGLVPHLGPLAKVVAEWEEGLKAALGYAGAKSLEELWEKAQFAMVSPAGLAELGPHGILREGEGGA